MCFGNISSRDENRDFALFFTGIEFLLRNPNIDKNIVTEITTENLFFKINVDAVCFIIEMML